MALPDGSPAGCLGFLLDGMRPWRSRQWAALVARVLVQVAIGGGHWREGRQRRAGAAWAIAAGTALSLWGLATEAPPVAEVVTRAPPPGRWFDWLEAASPLAEVAVGVPWGLRHPRRLSVPTAVLGTWPAVLPAVWAMRGTQKHRPRMAIGGALAAGGWVARLWAASAEPLG
ncbi:MAG: hypothetical protein ACRDZY_18355 [Acidimicrobiales bacterium]